MDNHVWLFYGREDPARLKRARKAMRRACQSRMWNIEEREVAVTKLPPGRPVWLVPPPVAAGVYKQMHRARVAVVLLNTRADVCLHPEERIAVRKRALAPLRTFVRYKSFFAAPKLDDENSWCGWITQFAQWCATEHCENEYDPRCLPLHVFRADVTDLSTNDGREAFNSKHGSGTLRRDDRGLLWRLNPRIFHGTEILSIAGKPLPRGFHWDVETNGRREISTPEGIWEIFDYVNVYPDAHLRPSGREHARRVC